VGGEWGEASRRRRVEEKEEGAADGAMGGSDRSPAISFSNRDSGAGSRRQRGERLLPPSS